MTTTIRVTTTTRWTDLAPQRGMSASACTCDRARSRGGPCSNGGTREHAGDICIRDACDTTPPGLRDGAIHRRQAAFGPRARDGRTANARPAWTCGRAPLAPRRAPAVERPRPPDWCRRGEGCAARVEVRSPSRPLLRVLSIRKHCRVGPYSEPQRGSAKGGFNPRLITPK